MKFQICGDLEAPDWVLAEISLLSQLSEKDVGKLTKLVVDLIISNKEDDDTKVDFDTIEQALKVTNFGTRSRSNTMAIIAILRYIVTNAVKYNISESVFVKELEQMGLKTLHCQEILVPFQETKLGIQNALSSQTLHLSKVVQEKPVSWRLNYVVESKGLTEVNTPSVHISMPLEAPSHDQCSNNTNGGNVSFELTGEQLRTLVAELRTAKAAMDQIET